MNAGLTAEQNIKNFLAACAASPPRPAYAGTPCSQCTEQIPRWGNFDNYSDGALASVEDKWGHHFEDRHREGAARGRTWRPTPELAAMMAVQDGTATPEQRRVAAVYRARAQGKPDDHYLPKTTAAVTPSRKRLRRAV